MVDVTAVPAPYKRAVQEELRGTLHEVSYSVNNYINASRELVTNQSISPSMAGRAVVQGEPITKRCNVYLPAGYDEQDANTRYDVLYLLHGVGGDQHEWLNSNGKADDQFIICNILDNLMANGDTEPLIVVFPNGRSSHDWTDNSFNAAGTNMLGFYYFDYELRYDLIPFIESQYHTIANGVDTATEAIAFNRNHRAIAGLSMGGMQALNMILGGYRHDSTMYTNTQSSWNNGLDATVLAPGMTDLFAYVGAFSNAPTSSRGSVLGKSIATNDHRLHVLYLTSGDKDGVVTDSYAGANDGLIETAGAFIEAYYQILVRDGYHNFDVWNNGAYNFIRQAFRTAGEQQDKKLITVTLQSY
ncbi:enterochelin esterase-like enzyme [Paenibacillus cellulosilyticus]|uniref:Enterochelin esterase-like enzyme n=1 Tax=Paenibacillus cellulosilyticus TaxID=375489 RepID=A0A2V2Z3B9_9BACL|nr:alpha/beta hydrolase-fold protein [Paenibacillus cellulosilyticus]PWW04723.1 enterochelin esterase-like enzyme [Paenibacillus cellulosilyticus]QKS45850.1 esterase [Paenibacillus cellulosilyticus]